VPQLKQVLAVAAQFAGHLGRRGRLGHPAEDQQELGRRPPDALQRGLGEGVEDAAAVAALVVQDRVTTPAMDAQAVAGAAARAGEAAGVEQADELGIAGVFVHQVDQGEVHRRASRSPRATPSTEPPTRSHVKWPSTTSAS
jgi:hypothetical protein